MSCRSTILCRPIAHQAHNYVWITDEILAEAFHRYTRISLKRQQLSQGKRHGSSIPGPLEARRRLAKRRMGMVAVGSANVPLMQDFAAFFDLGFGRNKAQSQPGQSWKWEPPSHNNLLRSSNVAAEVNASLLPGYYELQQPCQSWEDFIREPDDAVPLSNRDLVEDSRRAMLSLLDSQNGIDIVSRENLKDVLEFLQTSSDEVEAKNTLSLFKWLETKTLGLDCVGALVNLVLQKVGLGTLSNDDVASISVSLLQQKMAEHCDVLTGILDGLECSTKLEPICIHATGLLTQNFEHGAESRKHHSHIMRWLHTLRNCKQLQDSHHLGTCWPQIYALLSEACPDPSSLAQHFVKLEQSDLSYVLLHHWVPKSMGVVEAEFAEGSNVTHWPSKRVWVPPRPLHVKSIEIGFLSTEFKELQEQIAETSRRRNRCGPLIHLAALLKTHNLPHLQLLHAIFDIIKLLPPEKVLKSFKQLHDHPTLGADPELAANLVKYFCLEKKPEFALVVFEAVPTLSLRRCYELPLHLAKHSNVASSRILRVLCRKTPEDIVHENDRPVKQMSLRPEHIDIAHLMAYWLAGQAHVTDRVAFRRVWECYRFLRSHNAPISSVLTRAMVHAGVTRPLQNYKRISTMKFKWIHRLVLSVEGPDVAHALDRLAFSLWTQDVAPKIRAQRLRQGVLAMRQSESSDLKATKWRVKNWYLNNKWCSVRAKVYDRTVSTTMRQ